MAIRVLKNKQFARWARSERLTDKKLCAAVHEIESGLVDARLGGFLIKKRVGKDQTGKSGGLRTIIAHRQGDRLVFLFGFAKSDRENIGAEEKSALHKLGDTYMAKTNSQITKLVKDGVLLEVPCDGKD
ncbi:MAG: hypothetical protein CVT72_06145 [Alphaproteobacteria bacterium HGW-Alphaproteobacteria-11]|nr:MAG: hypothetical protein CVT72_06145 [Alphaproteobacteria bacterium HGW-Alphaproteobacteria-11]